MAQIAERDVATMRVIDELKRLYKTKILPLEQLYRFDLFQSPSLSDAEFDAKPQVMLVGQYSVGKTSFIRYLLGRDFPGQRIGPEPTTDKFVAVFDGPDERIIPGNALAVSKDMPYRGLERFGVSFLNRFEGSQVPCNVLKSITLVDTPGVLSGEKQRLARGYDFTQVCAWFSARADLILLLFDAHKLDISDEFKAVIQGLRGNDDKIRCVLNKADQVDRQRLMRVYGALMWSLGKVVATPEVLRVYIGSFWDQPLHYLDNKELFEMEERDLMKDLKDLPRNSAVRKINELVKRVRLAKTHGYIISYLKEQMPSFMGMAKKQAQLIETLPQVFRSVMKKYNLSPGDFPDIADFQGKLAEHEFQKFSPYRQKVFDDVENVLGNDFPRLMEALPRSIDSLNMTSPDAQPVLLSSNIATFEAPVRGKPSGGMSNSSTSNSNYPSPPMSSQPSNRGIPPPPQGSFVPPAPSPYDDDKNPWGDDDTSESVPASAEWALNEYIPTYEPKFQSIQKNGLVTGGQAKGVLSSSGLPNAVLRKIWDLSDIDKDGALDLHEFIIAMFITDMVKQGSEVPLQLDQDMYPPGKVPK